MIEKKISLKEYSTFHIGGDAEYFTIVRTKEELREAIQWARTKGCVWRVIGEGSNILFGDNLLKGLTIKNAIKGISISKQEESVDITANAGESLDAVVAYACSHGWWGLENLSHIPGTVGATPIQNVGAYGVEIAHILHSVLVYDSESDAFKILTSSDCLLGYRHSLFKEEAGKKYVICNVSFLLPYSAGPSILYRDLALYFKDTRKELTPTDVREAVIAIRSKKFPNWHTMGTAGSFFKNPIIHSEAFRELQARYPGVVGHVTSSGQVKVALGWILDHVCQVRGVREGAVGTYDAQALVVVNHGNATAEEVMLFAKKISSNVKEKTNINIECEVTYIST